ncbi:MAG TPA: MarR family winged helix-turn-helix transcriptional regulator [Streptosporangiaceae bacterium]|jgi:DNA-binding MarR family transcriptional regulator|nr:MarR family winged helix-turn-helix transcriptional regulator [Streptosporangiaceae bacterium]
MAADVSPNDTELELLLTQLLRMLSPAFAADDDSARPGAADGQAAASRGDDGHQAGASQVSGQFSDRSAPGGGSGGGPGNGDAGATPGVSASEARALIELISARGIAQGELAALLGLDKSTVSRLAAGLERKGWVRRGRDEANQRYVRLYLTPQGGAVAGRVWQAWQSRQARILAALSADERAGLSAGLGGLVRGLAAEGLLGETAGKDS